MGKTYLLSSILSHLTTNVISVDITQCTQKWCDIDYTPQYSKIYYILEGEGRIVINGKNYFPKPGQLCIMPANVIQSYEPINHNEYLKYWTHFTCESGERSIFDIIKVPYLIDIKNDDTHKKLKTIFKDMIKQHKYKTYTSDLLLESYIRELIAIYLQEAGLENIDIANSKDSQRQCNIINYINDNIYKKLAVEDIAHEVFLHPNYFIKYFRKTFGISPAKYINKRKMELASEMLRNDRNNVSEIAKKLGYSDIYHFSKVFKRHTGFSPSYYKKYIVK